MEGIQSDEELLELNKSQQELFKDVNLGLDVEAFMQSSVGKMILAKAENELESGFGQLVNANPNDTSTIVQLQSQCKRALTLKSWLAEAINNGLNAERELNEN